MGRLSRAAMQERTRARVLAAARAEFAEPRLPGAVPRSTGSPPAPTSPGVRSTPTSRASGHCTSPCSPTRPSGHPPTGRRSSGAALPRGGGRPPWPGAWGDPAPRWSPPRGHDPPGQAGTYPGRDRGPASPPGGRSRSSMRAWTRSSSDSRWKACSTRERRTAGARGRGRAHHSSTARPSSPPPRPASSSRSTSSDACEQLADLDLGDQWSAAYPARGCRPPARPTTASRPRPPLWTRSAAVRPGSGATALSRSSGCAGPHRSSKKWCGPRRRGWRSPSPWSPTAPAELGTAGPAKGRGQVAHPAAAGRSPSGAWPRLHGIVPRPGCRRRGRRGWPGPATTPRPRSGSPGGRIVARAEGLGACHAAATHGGYA